MEDFDRKILLSRKELSVLSAYYEQLSDMGGNSSAKCSETSNRTGSIAFWAFL